MIKYFGTLRLLFIIVIIICNKSRTKNLFLKIMKKIFMQVNKVAKLEISFHHYKPFKIWCFINLCLKVLYESGSELVQTVKCIVSATMFSKAVKEWTQKLEIYIDTECEEKHLLHSFSPSTSSHLISILLETIILSVYLYCK